MYYSYPQIQFQEVPDEISLSLSISGCNLHCKGCHSKETWNPHFGKELTDDELRRLLNRNKYISCVLFYGGEWVLDELEEKIDLIRKEYPHLKICLYTGRELDYFNEDFLKKLDYIKVGPYIEHLGGLASETTNQRFYVLKDGKVIEDKTSWFHKKGK
jgi:anaerobic ribonucleoside-triphosphate reductase activating protein